VNQEYPFHEQIPNKLYFRIGEVSDLVGVKPYVLRYWESEFTDIKPSKSKSGQRLYKRKDVEMLLLIKELLYRERFTITGARKRLKEWARAPFTSNGNGTNEHKTNHSPSAEDLAAELLASSSSLEEKRESAHHPIPVEKNTAPLEQKKEIVQTQTPPVLKVSPVLHANVKQKLVSQQPNDEHHHYEGKKVLLKLKKDLSEILHIIRT